MTSTGPQRSLCLLFALLLAGAIAIAPGCKDPEPAQNDGSSASSDSADGDSTSNTGTAQDPAEVDSEPLRAVLEFQQALLALDLERALLMVDETTPAHQSIATAIETLQTLENNPSLPAEARDMARNAIRSAWIDATAEEAVNEGGSAIIAVTRSNGDTVDVNLNFFEGKWLIIGPNDLTQLR
ncbi:MAG: hypothetical protein ACIAQF_06385 [Phycisphaerales bacterium JB065]